MNNLSVRRAYPDDAHYLAPYLREADVQEIRASSGHTPLEALLSGFAVSQPCFTAVSKDGDYPVAMFGVCETESPGVGCVWFLGTDEITKNRWQFLRQSRKWMERLHRKYPVLANAVDKRNTVHLAWLRWIGVQFVGETTRGPLNTPFVEFIHV